MSWFRASLGLGAAAALVAIVVSYEANMPLKRNAHVLTPLTPAEIEMRDRVRNTVQVLAGDIGGRDAARSENLQKAAGYIAWSDHWSFWQFGYSALMLTDTAPYRYPYYHSAQDTPEKLDYDRLARAVAGIAAIVRALGSR